ncbi:MAG: hypothetical protein AAGB31_12995 [Bdellovibrio sp.]
MWTKVVCADLKNELNRLKTGNALEVQRYNNAIEAMSRVMAEPILNGDGKSGLRNYKAADVLAQYRLFYEVLKEHNVVHFVWINNEKYIHDLSQTPDPCYDHFLTLINTNKLPVYTPTKSATEYTLSGTFGVSDFIYAKYSDSSTGTARSFLNITTDDKRTYHLKNISATDEDQGLEEILLSKVIKSATGLGIKLHFELDKSRDPLRVKFLENLLTKNNFQISDIDNEIELWELVCK